MDWTAYVRVCTGRRASRVTTASLCLLLFNPAYAAGQVCLRARSGSQCQWFTVTRFGAEFAYAGTDRLYKADEAALTWDVGLARNMARRYALGVTLRVATAYDWSVGLNALGRAWLTPTLAIDVKPGIMLRADPLISLTRGSVAEGNVPAITLGLAVSAAEWAMLTLGTNLFSYDRVCQPDCVRRRGSFADHWAGLQLGSYPGAIGIAASALVAAFAAVFILPHIGS